MAYKFNPFTDTLDLVGSSDSYIDGEVQYHSNLPVTLGSPAVNSAFLVRKGEGLYFISRKPAGIWVRELNNGNLDDWKYAGTFSDLYRDANFRIINDADVSKELAFSLSGITTGTTRTLTAPNKSGTIALTTDIPSVNVIELEADGTTTITTAQLPARGIAYADGGASFTVNLPTPDKRQSGLTFSIKTEHEAASGDVFVTVVHAAVNLLTSYELDEDEGSIDFVWDGYAWRYDTAYLLRSFPSRVLQLPAASGTIARTEDFAAPPQIGSTTPNSGAFTTLTVSSLVASGNVVSDSNLRMRSNTGQISLGAANDVQLFRGNTASVLELRSGTSPQTFRIYTTWANGGVDFERLFIRGQTLGAFQIGTEAGGTGSARALQFFGTLFDFKNRITLDTFNESSVTAWRQSVGLTRVANSPTLFGSRIKFLTGGTASVDPRQRVAIDASGNLVLGDHAWNSNPNGTAQLDIDGDTLRLRSARTPASAAAAGNQGDICWDADYIYICTATDTWKRAALATW
jgi:hypothetical protein